MLILSSHPLKAPASPSSKAFQAAAEQNPPANAPSALEERYRERTERNPKDTEALEGLAILQVKRGDYAGAIDAYRRLLALEPDNHNARLGLGRALALHGQYPQAVEQFREVLAQNPNDSDALEAMAQVHLWSGHPEWSLVIFDKLASSHPENVDYALGQARAQVRLRKYAEARKTLNAILRTHPHQHDAELQLAYLDVYQGHQESAKRRFNQLLRKDPTDREALEGNARVAYYRGDLDYARKLTSRLVEDDPGDTSSMLLLARVERALHHPDQARSLVSRTEAVDPGNTDARDLGNSLDEETRSTMHTAASFAHEVTTGNPSVAEDLITYGFENTWAGFILPRSQSFVSLYYLPSESPNGGIQGSVAPWQILYRQTTYLSPRLTFRFGAGLARYGPSDAVTIPSESIADHLRRIAADRIRKPELRLYPQTPHRYRAGAKCHHLHARGHPPGSYGGSIFRGHGFPTQPQDRVLAGILHQSRLHRGLRP